MGVATDFDKLRQSEFSVLDSKGHVYLDYTGTALIPRSMLSRQHKLFSDRVYGNPHSTNPASKLSTELVDRTRARVLRFFRASPQHYTVIFTANASNAIKLVAESFPFEAASTLALLSDNHNSVLGIREYASAAGASIKYAQIDSNMRAAHVPRFLADTRPHHAANLFAYPAQSNFSGVRHSLSYVRLAHSHRWFVLLDAAAYVPTSPLDLSQHFPDFVPVSFYKMLGIPTGVGALIVRKSSLEKLRRPWFAGGTVQFSAVNSGVHSLSHGPEAFEDGTSNYLNIALVKYCLDFMDTLGMRNVQHHVQYITHHLLVKMNHLRYADGQPMVRVYGPMNTKERGGTVAFDLLTARGTRRDASKVEAAASEHMISVRAGCFCNPGAAERALHRDFSKERNCLRRLNNQELSMGTMSKCMGTYLGCVRVSVGMPTNMDDIDKFIAFLREYSLHTD